MKVIIASDIHGSYEYTKKLEELIIKENPNQIILLGDILYQYHNMDELDDEHTTMDVVNILNKYQNRIIAVRGNCDSDVDDMILNFSILDEYKKIELDGITFCLSHGHLNLKYDYLFKNHYLLNGHTHVYDLEGKIINPGSVGYPRRHEEHTCLIYENHQFKLIDLDNFNVLQTKNVNK